MAEKFDEDAIEEQQEEQTTDQEEQRSDATEDGFIEGYGYPTPEEKPNAFQFFNKVLDRPDTSKVSNLNKDELGGTRLPVRDYQTMAIFQDNIGADKVAAYLRAKAAVIADTSLSREGFMMNLSITQKKERIKKGDKKNKWNK